MMRVIRHAPFSTTPSLDERHGSPPDPNNGEPDGLCRFSIVRIGEANAALLGPGRGKGSGVAQVDWPML